MFYRVVFNSAHYLSKQYYSTANELFDGIRVGPATPWEECAKLTLELFPLPLSASYVKRYTNNRTKEVVSIKIL